MTWNNFNIKSWIIASLQKNNINEPTKVQSEVIPLALNKNNLIVTSPTGTGKTHAFLIPILNDIEKNNKIQAIIMVPTRELGQQIFLFVKQLINQQPIKVSLFVGGQEVKKQIEGFKNKVPEIIIGSPTRIKMLYQEHGLNITTAKTLVLDECDMLFELGFIDDIDFLMTKFNSQIQCMAFSATISQQLQLFIKKYFSNTKIINLNKEIEPKIEHIFINCLPNEKHKQLLALINLINPYLCLIFVNNKNDIDLINKLLIDEGKKSVCLHSGLSPRNRNQVFKRIKNLDYQYVVSTDVSARGIDIVGVSHVISMQMPHDGSYYMHRAGRTGRNNQTGISYLFYDKNNLKDIQELKKFNINIKYFKIKDEQLVALINIESKPKPALKTKTALQTINHFHATKKVKPGYKKDFKNKMAKISKKEAKNNKKGWRK